jgi:hypothetical protein
LAALESSGFPTGELRAEDITNPDWVLQMGVEPVQIRVMSGISLKFRASEPRISLSA